MSEVAPPAAAPTARRRRLFRAAQVTGAALLAPWVLLGACAAQKDLPAELASLRGESGTSAAGERSVRVVDREGTVFAEVRTDEGARARPLPLVEFGDLVPQALLAAEDRRFRAHPGVDPLALARAAVDSVAERRITSGASTITQQLARVTTGAPRTLRAKWDVMATAVRIEASLSKDEILEAYLNRVDFGPNLRGAEAASRHYFDKAARDLSLAEAAALAGMPRGPSLYDPRKRPELVVRRRDRVLDRMAEAGFVDAERAARAKGEPLVLSRRHRGLAAPHLVEAVLDGAFDPTARARDADVAVVHTSVIADLQRESEVAAGDVVAALAPQGVTAASVVVLDNATGEVLAYVGSPGLDAAQGHNDGVRALRQPGSALKPFVYALAIERLGLTPATVLADVETAFVTGERETWTPHNYDRQFHGPVLLREALASSLNVPAVALAERLGPAAVLDQLRALGFTSLELDASHYGLALALGDGEVRLLDLANAYATLARGGELLPVRAVVSTERADGTLVRAAVAPSRRVIDERAARLVLDVLADPSARAAAFGSASALDLPFSVAAKTGTSKGYRDNVAVGVTPELTVAVWVGNFDGSPMRGVSGITGAGPLFARVFAAAARHRPPTAFPPVPGTERREVCALSGAAPTAACTHRIEEIVPHDAAAPACSMHREVPFDRATGLRAGSTCPADRVELRSIEELPPVFGAWARGAGRTPPPFSSLCPADPSDAAASEPPRMLYPEDGARFLLDAGQAAPAAVVLRASHAADARRIVFHVDGRALPGERPALPLVRGEHEVVVEVDGRRSAPIRFTVE